MKYLNYFYGAYGSNLNRDQMSHRCPNAVPVGTYDMIGQRLTFRGVADIEKSRGNSIQLGIWQITERCEIALDIYEGYPNFYTKMFVSSPFGQVMIYTMQNKNTVKPPSNGYLDSIARGYKNFGLDSKFLQDAVRDSYVRQSVSF